MHNSTTNVENTSRTGPRPSCLRASSESAKAPEHTSRLATAAAIARARPGAPIAITYPAIVRTERLTLRPLCTEDRAEFMRALRASRDHLAQFCPLDKAGLTNESEEAIFERQLQYSIAAIATGRAWRRVAVADDGRIAGAFCINDIQRGLENAGEIVLWISAEFDRQGFGNEGLRATMRFAFADLPDGLGLQRLSALIDPANTRCLALMGALGFTLCPGSVPIELILSGRHVRHDTYAAYAPLTVHPQIVGRPEGDHRQVFIALANVLKTEAAAQFAA